MDILNEIISHKRREVESRKALFPLALLEQSRYFAGNPVSLSAYLRRTDKSGVIAEIKRKSPSKGDINKHVSVERTSIGYMMAGASALSVLTDSTYFGGSSEDLETARAFNFCPILRKDFIIDAYQVVEAKSIGADAILLIAACLSAKEIDELGSLAHSLGMEVLCEVHSADELPRALSKGVDLVGVNNRDLRTFKTNVATSLELADQIPPDFLRVSESGMKDPNNITGLAALQPDFMGFIFYEKSPRHVGDIDPARVRNLPSGIRKVGVFVNASTEDIIAKAETYSLDFVQLHGDESPEFIAQLKNDGLRVIKVFRIGERLPTDMDLFAECTDLFLFDTATKNFGGSGLKFDWDLLRNNDIPRPYLLSGGIAAEDVESVAQLNLPGLTGIDVNSRFETSPGIKDLELIRRIIPKL